MANIITSCGTMNPATGFPQPSHMIFDGINYWCFYTSDVSGDAGSVCYRTTTNPSSWGSEQKIAAPGISISNKRLLVVYNATTQCLLVIYYITSINYMLGQIDTGAATITWGSPTSINSSAANPFTGGGIDSTGVPFMCFSRNSYYATNVLNSSFTDSFWTHKTWTATYATNITNCPIFSLGSGNLLAIEDEFASVPSQYKVLAYVYSGGSWGSGTTLWGASASISPTNWSASQISITNTAVLGISDTNTFSFSWYNGSSWASLTAPTYPSAGLKTTSSVTLENDGINYYAFVIDGNGYIEINTYNGSSWSGWSVLGGDVADASRNFIQAGPYISSNQTVYANYTHTNGSNFEIWTTNYSFAVSLLLAESADLNINSNRIIQNSQLNLIESADFSARVIKKIPNSFSFIENTDFVLTDYINKYSKLSVTENADLSVKDYIQIFSSAIFLESSNLFLNDYKKSISGPINITENADFSINSYINKFNKQSLIESTDLSLINYINKYSQLSLKESADFLNKNNISEYSNLSLNESADLLSSNVKSTSSRLTLIENADFNVNLLDIINHINNHVNFTENTDLLLDNYKYSVCGPINLTESADFLSNPTFYKPPPLFFVPTSLSGCFGWYPSTSIGLGNAPSGAVTYWPDLSGSGNNLIPLASSNIPYYYSNQLNGYPTVRFDGSTDYLTTSGSITISNQNFTSFVVFNTTNPTADQFIFSFDYQPLNNNSIEFLLSSNNFWYYYNKISNQIGSNNLNIDNKYYIRSDGYNKDNKFFIRRNGTTVNNLTAGINSNAKNPLYVGRSLVYAGNYLTGNIAELILYNRPLNSGELTSVEQYLAQKYNIPGNNSFPLFLYTTDTDSTSSGIYSDINLYTTSAVASGFPLYMSAKASGTAKFPLYVGSITSISGGFPLYTSGVNFIANSTSLYIGSSQSGINSFPLYIGNSQLSSGVFPIYISGVNLTTASIPLYMFPTQLSSSNVPLYLMPTLMNESGIFLYTGAMSAISGNTPIYMSAYITTSGNFPAFIWGDIPIDSGKPLYIGSSLSISGQFTLYTHAIASGHAIMPLTIYNPYIPPNTGTASTTLYTFTPSVTGIGINSLYDNIPLNIYGLGQSATMPLFLKNTDFINPTGFIPSYLLPLYLQAPPVNTGTYFNSIPLMIGNYTQVASGNPPMVKMFVQGDGILIGGSVETSNMVMFLDRPTANLFPLYVQSNYNFNEIPLMLQSSNIFGGSGINLSIIGYGASGELPLYIAGPGLVGSGISLFTKGLPTLVSNVNLFNHGF